MNGKIETITFTTSPESLAEIQAASVHAPGQAGMPKTGVNDPAGAVWLSILGLGAIVIGLGLNRYGAIHFK